MRTGLNHIVANSRLGFLLLAASLAIGCRSTPAPESRSSAPETPAQKLEMPPLVAGTTTRPHFAVQVGAMGNRTQADQLALQLANRYKKQVLIQPTKVGEHTLYRVRILVETKPEAEALVVALRREQDLKAFIVPFP
jgi:cell division septation protein DedD